MKRSVLLLFMISVNMLLCSGSKKSPDIVDSILFKNLRCSILSKLLHEEGNKTETHPLLHKITPQKSRIRKKILKKRRLRRSLGSVKLQGYLKQKFLEDQDTAVPPTFVALVFLDVIAAIFTFNAVAALLFVANHY